MKDAANEMAVETFAKRNVEWVAPDVVAADMGQLEQGMGATGCSEALCMRANLEFLLFQADLLVPFSKGAGGEILSITLPAWSYLPQK